MAFVFYDTICSANRLRTKVSPMKNLFDTWREGLLNKKPVAIIALVGVIIVGFGSVMASCGSIWDFGERVYYKWVEMRKASEKEAQELDNKKRIFEEKRSLADKIFIEVLANLKKIDVRLEGKSLSRDNPDFQTANYEKWYSNFGIGELDRQIANFYANLRNNDVWSSVNRNDWVQVKGQGEDVKRMLTLYFCCKDYYHVRFRETRAVSQDTVEVLSSSAVDSMNIASGAIVEVAWRDSCFWSYLSAVDNIEAVLKSTP